VNAAVVIDCSRHLDRVLQVDAAGRKALVEPGVVCDALREAAEAHGLTFAPDPATHSRCTLGGMIGNNSCGAHSVMAGMTVDNIERLEECIVGLPFRVLGKSADVRREEILEAARAEFSIGGLHGTSTEDIARRAGVSQPYIFRLFGTKKELFLETVRRGFRHVLEVFQEAAAANREAPLTYVAAAAPPPAGDVRGFGASLGTIPDYAGPADGRPGVLLAGVRAGGPAEKGGLRRGDLLVELAGHPIRDIQDFMFALRSAKPGQQAVAAVERDGHRVELIVTFGVSTGIR